MLAVHLIEQVDVRQSGQQMLTENEVIPHHGIVDGDQPTFSHRRSFLVNRVADREVGIVAPTSSAASSNRLSRFRHGFGTRNASAPTHTVCRLRSLNQGLRLQYGASWAPVRRLPRGKRLTWQPAHSFRRQLVGLISRTISVLRACTGKVRNRSVVPDTRRGVPECHPLATHDVNAVNETRTAASATAACQNSPSNWQRYPLTGACSLSIFSGVLTYRLRGR